VALEAAERGEFATVALIPPGRKLRINALTQRAGFVTVEVADMKGTPIAGRSFAESVPITGDHFWTTVAWRGVEDLGYPDNTAIMLRFRMEQARIFGLRFEA